MFTIRRITEADIPGFWNALDSVARESKFLRADAAPPIDGVSAFVSSNIETGNPQMVAVVEGEIIGWCDIVRAPAGFESHCGELGMGVVSAWQGRGVGTALLTETLAAADAAGFLRVGLTVHSDNPRAMALYRRFGFLEEGRKLRARIKDGVALDVILMARLRPDAEWPDAASLRA